MQILPLSEPVPADATDFALGIVAANIAWMTNRVIVLDNANMVAIPPGWEAALADDGVVIIYFNHQAVPEVCNA